MSHEPPNIAISASWPHACIFPDRIFMEMSAESYYFFFKIRGFN